MTRHWLPALVAGALLVAAPAFAEEPAPESAPASKASAEPGEQKLAQAGSQAPKPEAPAQPAPPPPRLTFGGSADFYFLSATNDPFTGFVGGLVPPFGGLRAFDVEDERGVHLGLIDLWAQYARDPIGFRLDVDFGPTTKIVHAFEPSNARKFWRHFQQAFVSANLNRSGTTYVDFGKWVTTAGAEVIEPKDNWLTSRGLLFTWAIPFYHFGGRVYHYYNDTDYVVAGIHRGWNAVGDPDHGVGMLLAGGKVMGKWSFVGNYYGGEETLALGSPGTSWRNLFDIVATYTASPRWTHVLNFDYAQQSHAKWYGISAMTRYTLNPKQYLVLRGEWLRDTSGALFGDDADVYSVTAGFSHQFNRYFQTRLEYRHDFSAGAKLFANDSPTKPLLADQGAVLLSAILSY